MNERSTLIELVVQGPSELEVGGAGQFEASWELWDRGPYPPVPRLGARPVKERRLQAGTSWFPALAERVGSFGILAEALPPDTFFRVALVLDHEHQQTRWEELCAQQFGPSVAVVRRHPRPQGAGARVEEVAPPIRVHVAILVDGGGGDELPIGRLFEGLADEVRAIGLDWSVEASSRASALIVHALVDSSSPESARRAAAFIRDLRGGTAPRLLVLHDIGLHDIGQRDPSGLTPLLSPALDGGAGAVLIAALGSPDPGWAGVMPTFYRKILHDLPLDACAVAASEIAREQGAPTLVLGAVEGGETALLLTRAVAAAVERALPSLSFDPGSFPESATRSRSLRSAALDVLADMDTTLLRAAVKAHDFSIPEAVAQEMLDALAGPSAEREIASARARETSLWLAEDGDPTARSVPSLVVERWYRAHVRVGKAIEGAAAHGSFPEDALREVFRRVDAVELDVRFFVDSEAVTLLPRPDTKLTLARFGDSTTASVTLAATRPGATLIRVCLLFEGVLLQSLAAELVFTDASAPAGPAPRSRLDFATVSDLAARASLPRPTIGIFTNDAPGAHWIGVFEGQGRRLRAGRLKTMTDAELTPLGRILREELGTAAGTSTTYRYKNPPQTPAERALKAQTLVSLARAGARTYDALFGDDGAQEEWAAFGEALAHPGVVSIARCKGDGPSIPWAGMYDLPLAANSDQVRLCSEFQRQLETGADLLDRPAECFASAGCPLRDAAARHVTVCPFGFWGYRHEIEQPMQHVEPPGSEDGGVPPEVRKQIRDASDGDGQVNVLFAVYRFQDVDEHKADLAAALGPRDPVADATEILRALREEKHEVHYFYCHGVEHNGFFVLKVGDARSPGFIGTTELPAREIRWTSPKPLVFLNGCETLALIPETINKLSTRLRTLGASGIIGTEIAVPTPLARSVARLVFKALTSSDPGQNSLGAAFLAMRRALLREWNPLGLAYTFYGSSALRIQGGAPSAPSTPGT
ncbi:hypothetical protein BE21_19370 [Sorangium cellulosum]|uniref:CHAT domain-containing protein n=1 Tax=Sorangium cellulosum TaxID=56 RepID=A0A150TXI4_SORCE|nr:hypothetical protein BE21_19370 [Sorangium cellulosum]